MDKVARLEALREIKIKNPHSTHIPLVIEGETRYYCTYKIPLECLIYNKYNGRIGSLVKSYEAENGELYAENKDDSAIISNFLYESNERRNKNTLNDLSKYKQLKHGIVTSDGVIIDGNRRAMLLNKLYEKRADFRAKGRDVGWSKYFIAIILDESIESDSHKIQELETLVQVGEDAKVDYNPIEKYLKCKELYKWASIEDIAEWRSEKPADIRKYIDAMDLMDEFLDNLDYSGIYTRLEKKEDQFLVLCDNLQAYRKGSKFVKWDYDSEYDVDVLKEICFDYIRADYEGKEFRNICQKSSEKGFFCNQDVWENFCDRHEGGFSETFGENSEKTVEELRKELPNTGLSDILKKRDEIYKNKIINKFKENMGVSQHELDNKNDANEYIKLLKRAKKTLESINRDNSDYYDSPEAFKIIDDIRKMVAGDKKIFEKTVKRSYNG